MCCFGTFGTIGAQPLESLGEWLIAARERAGISQRSLSRSSGISQAQISKIEAGLVGSEPKTLGALVVALAGPDATPEEVESLRREALAASVGLSGEMEKEPNEEYLQSQVLGYTGDNPILRAAATTARAVKEGITAQDVAEAMEEAEEVPDGERFSTSKITRRR
jgi:transcriptional regulator with XRE-family HTH domain